jgi:hypothetical protein
MSKLKLVKKDIPDLKVNEGTYCKHSGKYSGVSIGRDKDGYFAFTHRARSKSFETPSDIPDHALKWIRSTG